MHHGNLPVLACLSHRTNHHRKEVRAKRSSRSVGVCMTEMLFFLPRAVIANACELFVDVRKGSR